MTADIELLPLPDDLVGDLYDYEDRELRYRPTRAAIHSAIQDYARAVAEHNVRFLAHELANAECAIDAEQAGRKKAEAEIEALRAEVRDLRRRQAGWERHVAAAGCEYVRDGEHDALVNRRAERLAEAIRAYKAECDNPAKDYVLRAKRRDEMFALLRDHDQEVKDG